MQFSKENVLFIYLFTYLLSCLLTYFLVYVLCFVIHTYFHLVSLICCCIERYCDTYICIMGCYIIATDVYRVPWSVGQRWKAGESLRGGKEGQEERSVVSSEQVLSITEP